MKAARLWSVRNARWLKKCYAVLEGILALINPLLKAIGHERLDKPFAVVEGAVKGFLFDSQSCGQCTLGETGMACPHELSENAAQWTLWRRPPEWRLRDQTGDDLCLGQCLGRKPENRRPRRYHSHHSAPC